MGLLGDVGDIGERWGWNYKSFPYYYIEGEINPCQNKRDEHIEKRMEEETLMQDRLAGAIQLRETGRAKQDQAILEEARTLLLEQIGRAHV